MVSLYNVHKNTYELIEILVLEQVPHDESKLELERILVDEVSLIKLFFGGRGGFFCFGVAATEEAACYTGTL